MSVVTSTLPVHNHPQPNVGSPQDAARACPSKVGRFQVLDLLGQGGQGSVYLGHDPQLDRPVAIKRLHLTEEPSSAGRVAREAQILALLNHANVVRAYELVREAHADYIVTEYVEGTTLSEIQRQPMALSRKLDLAMQIARGLQHAHGRNVLHRDLKPGNILIDKDGCAKITDFGIAMFRDETRCSDHLQAAATRWLQLSGTPSAMAPEQTLGQPTDHRSDIFSLGSLYYQLFTGSHAFAGASDMGIAAKVRGAPHTPAIEVDTSIPPKLSRLFDRMLAKKPSARPGSMDVIINVLDQVIDQQRNAESLLDIHQHDVAQPIGAILECKCDLQPYLTSGADRTDGALSLELDLDGLAAGLAHRLEATIVASYAGRIVVCVGVPQVHEQVARVAVRFAWELQRCIAERSHGKSRRPIAIRIGLAVGRVQVRDGPRTRAWGGQVFERAATLCAAAQDGQLVVDAGMQSQLQAAVEATSLGCIMAPGNGRSYAAFSLHSARTNVVKVDALHRVENAQPLPPSRVDTLERVEQALFGPHGPGRVHLFGPAGVGKTHLVHRLLQRQPPAELRWVMAEGDPTHRFQAFGGLIALLEQLMRLPMSGDPQARVRAYLAPLELSNPDLLPRLLALLAPRQTHHHTTTQPQTGATDYCKTLQSAVQILVAAAKESPLLVILEGAQWLDHSSQEAIARTCSRLPGDRFRLLLTSRTGSPILDADLPRFPIAPLEEAEAQDFLDELSQQHPLSAHDRQQIVDAAEGIPLLLEIFGEQAQRAPSPTERRHLPGLEATITVRLEELGELRRVAEYAAVLGREFSERVLARALRISSLATHDALLALEDAQLIARRDVNRGQWSFVHGTVHDAVYQGIASTRRRQMHAALVEFAASNEVKTDPWPAAVLARHCRQAQLFAEAADAYREAANDMMATGAYFEARGLLEAALSALGQLPSETEYLVLERELRVRYSQCLVASEGWCSDAKQDNTRRLEVLRSKLGAEISPASTIGSFMAAVFSGDLTAARAALARLDPHPADDELTFLHCTASGYLDFFTGHWDRAMASYDTAIAIRKTRLGEPAARQKIADCGLEFLSIPDHHATLIKLARQQEGQARAYLGQAPGATASSFTSPTSAGVVELTFLGYGVTQALLVSHLPHGAERLEHASIALHTMASAQKNALYCTFAQLGQGYAQVLRGDREGLKWMQRAQQSMDAMGIRGALRLYYDCYYVRALLQADLLVEAQQCLESHLDVARGELATFCRPDFLILTARVHGLTAGPDGRDAALSHLDEALLATQMLAERDAPQLKGHLAYGLIAEAYEALSAPRDDLTP